MSHAWYDGHCHLADPRWSEALPGLLEQARRASIVGWVQGGVDPADWERQLLLSRKEKGLITCFGLHPWWIAGASASQLEVGWTRLTEMAPSAQAIGETGLDRARERGKLATYSEQKRLFGAQLELAKRLEKPLVLHVVRAHDEALKILEGLGPFPRAGIVHAFSESREIAKRYLDLGFSLSFGAEATRANESLGETLRFIPRDRLIVETDAPDQAPFVGGQRRSGLNEPSFLLEMARAVGHIRGEQAERLLTESTRNIKRIFGIKE